MLSETAEVFYKCDEFYNKENEAGLLYNDPTLKIDWKIKPGKEIISAKDLAQPTFVDCKNNFEY